MDVDSRLAQLATLNQKDKGPACLTLLSQILSLPDLASIPTYIWTLVSHVVNQDAVGLVVGRQVLTDLVKALDNGVIKDNAIRKAIVQDTLSVVRPRIVTYEEQANALSFQLADILEDEEAWSEAAQVLSGISLDSGQRAISDAEKLRLYVRIVRLWLEEGDSVQAETYYNRAAPLIRSVPDRETGLQFKLCQARILDYARRFIEAASRYHELSYVGEIDEEERLQMLSAAVTCAVLAPAGPNRSRLLAALNRDERTLTLPTYNILSKMFLDQIIRSAEVKSFEATLKTHQLAKIAISSNDRLASAVQEQDDDDANTSKRTGPSTVLDRAVMEHNLLACSRVYNNITFRGLGTLLDLTPGAAETMARRMIQQGRLRGSIDQVDQLISFDGRTDEDNAQGKAGGLGDVDLHAEDTGSPHTKRWDMQIRLIAANVESIVENLLENGLVIQNRTRQVQV